MQTILAPFLSFLLLYKYAGLFLIAFIGAFAIPVPASTTLVAAGAFAEQGYLNMTWVIVAALLGNVAGDAVGFIIAAYYGEAAISAIGLGRLVRSPRYQQLTNYIADFPQSIIFFTRFITELGPITNLLAGLSGVSAKTFFIFDILGETLYVLFNAFLGYVLGTQWQNNLGFLSKVALTILPFAITINLIQVLLFRRRSRK